MPGTLVAGGGTGIVTPEELVVSKKAVVSSTPHTKSCPSTMNVSDISSSEMSQKETESKVETQAKYAQIKLKTTGKGKR